jgi:hypothetical protein
MLSCKAHQVAELRLRQKRACRIVRADDDDCGNAGRPGCVLELPGKAADVDPPASMKLEAVLFDAHVVEVGKVLHERITWTGSKKDVSGIAQQLEQKRICLARTGGQDNPFRRHLQAATPEIC